jgi:NADPH-dependent ferric siderophore reductase
VSTDAAAETTEKPKPLRRPLLTEVISKRRLSPEMIRIEVGGPDLAGFPVGEFSDTYVKLQFPAPGAGYEPPFAIEELRSSLPRELWPRVRTYTVAGWDADRSELTIDFVCHGSDGVAGPWAEAARPGDRLQLVGPGGGYTPDPGAGSHLLIGDLCVVPAIEAAIARIPAGVPATVLVEVDDEAERREFTGAAELDVRWFVRDADAQESPLVAAVRQMSDEELLAPTPQLFIHGEAGMVRAVRRELLVERGLPGEHPSISGYWKRSRTEEGWREDKPEWKRLVAADASTAPV